MAKLFEKPFTNSRRALEKTCVRLFRQIKDRDAKNPEIVPGSLIWIVSSLNVLTSGQLTEAICHLSRDW